MEDPAPQTGPDIEGAHSAWTAEATNDQKILVGDARGVKPDTGCALHIQACAKVNGTILPEASDDLTGFRIKRIKVTANSGEEPLLAAGLISPEDQPALPRSSATGPFGLRV